MSTVIVTFLIVFAFGWYFLSKKDPIKYAPFLNQPYKKKREIVLIVFMILIGSVINTLDTPTPKPAAQKVQEASDKATKESNPQKSSDAYKTATNKIKSAVGIDDARAHGILDTFSKVGIKENDINTITSYEDGKHDTDDEKVYLINTGMGKVFLYLDSNNQIISIRANAKNLYKNGKIINSYINSFD
jgi:Na+-transporting methylmalonyl-CoA/oxaloacetate decarboxylase gamma subunit